MTTNTPATPKLLLTPAEAAKALSLNRSTLYGLLMSGAIESLTVGRARRISVRALEAWIAAKERGDAAADEGVAR
jgi:excisionase family DNA binding protein